VFPRLVKPASAIAFRAHPGAAAGVGGVFMRSHGFAARPEQAPRVGNIGMLTLHYSKTRVKRGLRLRRRVAHTRAGGVGINTFYQALSEEQYETTERIIRTGGNLP
jgi:hypothetical protein